MYLATQKVACCMCGLVHPTVTGLPLPLLRASLLPVSKANSGEGLGPRFNAEDLRNSTILHLKDNVPVFAETTFTVHTAYVRLDREFPNAALPRYGLNLALGVGAQRHEL